MVFCEYDTLGPGGSTNCFSLDNVHRFLHRMFREEEWV